MRSETTDTYIGSAADFRNMGEKTDELRDLFETVAGTDTVTERQTDDRGTLTGTDEATVDRRLREILAELDEQFPFETDLEAGTRIGLIRGFYRGDSDPELADHLGIDEGTVVAARLEVHLFRESDTDAPVPWERFRRRLGESGDDELASAFDLEAEAIERYRAVAAAREAARRVNHRFRSAYRDVLPEGDLAEPLTGEATEDGLAEAAADIETDVSF